MFKRISFSLLGIATIVFMIMYAVSVNPNLSFRFFQMDSPQDVNKHTSATPQRAKTATEFDLSEKWIYALQGAMGGKDEIDGVTVDTKGNIIFGGPYEYTVKFNGVSRTAKNGTDIHLTKLRPDGTEAWFISIDSGADDWLWDITSDQNDDIYLSGGYGGTLEVNGRTYKAYRDGSAFFAKVDGRTGDFIWFLPAGVRSDVPKNIDATKTAGGNEIKIDNEGNVLAILSASGAEYQIADKKFVRSGVMDSFILKISPSGRLMWVHQFMGEGRKQARALGITGDNDVIFGHQVVGQIKFNNGEVYSGRKARMEYGVLGVLNSEGEIKWTMKVASDEFTNVRGVGGDTKGNIYFTGVFSRNAVIGSEQISNTFQSAMYVAKYTNDGKKLWVRVFANDEFNQGGELVANDNYVAFTGRNSGDNYHMYDEKQTLLASNVHTASSRASRGTFTVLTPAGELFARHEPKSADYSNGGVLEFVNDRCFVYQQAFYGNIEFSNGIKFATQQQNRSDKDVLLLYICQNNVIE
jgi:hypothetical protein